VIEAQQQTDFIEQFMISSQCVRCPKLPGELYAHHLSLLEQTPELSNILLLLGLSVQGLVALDNETFRMVMWELSET
jgi:hypothetical protein